MATRLLVPVWISNHSIMFNLKTSQRKQWTSINHQLIISWTVHGKQRRWVRSEFCSFCQSHTAFLSSPWLFYSSWIYPGWHMKPTCKVGGLTLTWTFKYLTLTGAHSVSSKRAASSAYLATKPEGCHPSQHALCHSWIFSSRALRCYNQACSCKTMKSFQIF